ncbi:uncharacterized protein LOC125660253 [Ostrea edulis]|uniref:uncharacterized protein LOC125660253 n=1 Tax=Ostrea edulis TaxID=37623 RepID=UPI0024AFF6B4|nr:uncharacterized protein LOC125660253 [Ostrea edulis]
MTRIKTNINWLWCFLLLGADICCAQTKLLTYNAGLLETIPYKQERGDYIAANIGQSDPDIICLQEVWLRKDVEFILSINQFRYPYFLSGVHKETRPKILTPCSNISLISVMFKLVANGCTSRTTPGQKAQCVVEKTGAMDLPQKCISCLAVSATGGFKFTNLLQDCVLTSEGEVNLPGVLVLSKRPMINPQVKYFMPAIKKTVYRGYIHFQDEKVGDIACTHLTANLGFQYIEPNLQSIFQSYEDQNFFETVTMEIDLKSASRVVIMGDLNFGGGIPQRNIKEEFGKSYHHLMISGYHSPYVDNVGLCTYCGNNALAVTQYDLTNTESDQESSIIDHIFVRGISVVYSQRVFTEFVPGLPFTPSDHFGVQATVIDKGHDLKVHVKFNVTN